VQGVMARHVDDLRTGLLAVAGPHPRDPLSLPVTLAGAVSEAPLRVAALAEPPNGTTDPGIAAAVRRTADVLADAGHEVGEAAPASYARSVELWAEVLLPDIRAVRPLFDDLLSDDARAFLDFANVYFPAIETADWAMLFIERHAVARDWATFFESWDVLLTPTWSQPPFAHGADVASFEAALATLELMRPVLPANLLGLPAVVVPAGVVDGLPVGAQLTGNRFADLVVLEAAQAVEDALGPITPIEPVTRPG
jgi:amidase